MGFVPKQFDFAGTESDPADSERHTGHMLWTHSRGALLNKKSNLMLRLIKDPNADMRRQFQIKESSQVSSAVERPKTRTWTHHLGERDALGNREKKHS